MKLEVHNISSSDVFSIDGSKTAAGINTKSPHENVTEEKTERVRC